MDRYTKFLGLCLLFAVMNAGAQNTFPSTGNVGIGTTNPLYALDVRGTISLAGFPVFDWRTISTPADGTYVIASGGRIHGEYILSWSETPNRVQTVHLLVNANQFDSISSLQILENHSYQRSAIMSNFRLLESADGSTVYLVMDVGNRNGGAAVNVQYQGSAGYGSAFGGTLAGNEANIGWIGLTSVESSIGIGTTAPIAALDVRNGIIHVGGQVNPTTTVQGAYIGWNSTGGQGETDFINNPGGGSGGFSFISVPPSGGPQTKVMSISPTGNITLASGASITFPDGTIQSTAGGTGSCPVGGDYAESVDITGDRSQYEPGDVIAIDPVHPGHFLKASNSYSTLVAGVYSTKPGFVGRRQPITKSRDGEIPMAMVGIVPTKVSAENGAIQIGDLLVASSTSGRAMKGTDHSLLEGAVIGKALGALQSGTGVIEVLISLQ